MREQKVDPTYLLAEQPRHSMFILSSFVGALVAGALTWFMFVLIQSGNEGLDESERVVFADFIQAQRNEKTRTRERLPDKPVAAEAPPVPESSSSADIADGEALAISSIAIDASVGDMNTKLGFGSGDGEYLPIVKVAPIYPMRAESRGVEGSCLVVYTVTPAGTVENVRVIEQECSDEVFYKPSINAALKFRYKPRVIDGQSVTVPGVQNRFIYKLRRGGE